MAAKQVEAKHAESHSALMSTAMDKMAESQQLQAQLVTQMLSQQAHATSQQAETLMQAHQLDLQVRRARPV